MPNRLLVSHTSNTPGCETAREGDSDDEHNRPIVHPKGRTAVAASGAMARAAEEQQVPANVEVGTAAHNGGRIGLQRAATRANRARASCQSSARGAPDNLDERRKRPWAQTRTIVD